MCHHLSLIDLSVNIFIFLDNFLRKVVLVVNLVHLALVVLIVIKRIIELVYELLSIVSAVLMHLNLPYCICLILHRLVNPFDKALIPHQKSYHPHLTILLWSVLLRRKTASV